MDDLISRQAAIDALGERPMIWTGGDYELGVKNQYDADVRALETVPSAQSERPKGHWIDTGSGQECSECGEIQYGYDNFRYYCARCGARMEGVG